MRTAPHFPSPSRPRHDGFTLVEILVVIGIVVGLAAILVPMIGRAMRQAKQTRTAADIQSIATAIEAFKADHGDIPRTDAGVYNTGAAILGRYLNGPLGDGTVPPYPPGANDPVDPPAYSGTVEYKAGDAIQNAGNRYVALIPNVGVVTSDTKTWAQCNQLNDGSDGPGIRIRAGGKKYGPYVASEKMAMQGVAFIDGNGHPILYFPAGSQKGDLTGTGALPDNVYVYRSSLAGASKAAMKYDVDDNFEVFRRSATEADVDVLLRIRSMLGDYNSDGVIDTTIGERVATEAPYLLWSAGTDGRFGPDAEMAAPPTVIDIKDVDKCDDVTNFK